MIHAAMDDVSLVDRQRRDAGIRGGAGGVSFDVDARHSRE